MSNYKQSVILICVQNYSICPRNVLKYIIGAQNAISIEFGVEPIEFGVEPTELGVEPIELGVEPTELGVEPTELGVEPTELGVEPTELGVKQLNTKKLFAQFW